jgi:hypothetical protein
MKVESHMKRVQESIEVIEEAIEKGIVKRQRTIGFNTSAACADLLEILLHKNDLIDPGFMIKHEWLKAKNKVKDKFPFEFPKKREILSLIYTIEEKRDKLCYGTPQREEVVREVLECFNKVKEIFRECGIDEI